ncbi:hypothetical protein D8B26_007836 [Coccidioides posadasii str. Silveira]|uniref:uncharacterized protein n=1 Tax=Coccidioides posadasii (strain RMSCC 757 / Silveira) TaxID=443226 RepID=UPI001BF03DAC|nr:hypothetical protein D8B26_007836 [Coccidioides posadasii str. Silveira]
MTWRVLAVKFVACCAKHTKQSKLLDTWSTCKSNKHASREGSIADDLAPLSERAACRSTVDPDRLLVDGWDSLPRRRRPPSLRPLRMRCQLNLSLKQDV